MKKVYSILLILSLSFPVVTNAQSYTNNDYNYQIVNLSENESNKIKKIPHYQQEKIGNYVYYINNLVIDGGGGSLYRYNILTGANEEVVNGDITDFKIYGNRIFFNQVKLTNNSLYVLDLKYTDTPMLISKYSARDLVFHNSYLYYVRENQISVGTEIIKMDLSDYAETPIYQYNVHNIVIHDNQMYFIKGIGMDDVFYGDLDNKGNLVHVTQIGSYKTSYFVIQDNFLYMRQETGTFIKDYHLTRLSLDNFAEVRLNSNYDTVSFIITDSLVYFANNVFGTSNDGLYTMSLTGTNVTKIIDGIYPKDIIIDSNVLYFYNHDTLDGDSRLYKFNQSNNILETIDNKQLV